MALKLRPKIVLLGDSITEFGFDFASNGWGLQLASWYGVKADVVNRGQSGYNTQMILDLMDIRAEGWHEKGSGSPADIVVVFLGANDAAMGTIQTVEINDYKKNLGTIIDRIEAVSDSTKIILITPPPVDESRWRASQQQKHKLYNPNVTDEQIEAMQSDRTSENTGKYAKTAVELGAERNVVVLDFFTVVKEHQDSHSLLQDGLHLSTKGNDFLFVSLSAIISSKLPNFVPPNMKKDFGEWRDFAARKK